LVVDNPILALDAVGPSTPTVENRQLGDTGIGQNTSKARTPIGEGRQRGAFRSADSVEAPADQHLDVRVGSGDGAENLPATRLRFDIANPYLQVTFSVLATSNEGGIQSDRDRRRRRFRPDRGTIPKCSAGSQGMATHGLFVVAGADRKHLLQYVSGRPIGHQGREMGLKPIQLRCRPAMRWPVDPNLDHTTRGAAKSGKPHHGLTEKRGDRMIPIVLHVTNTAAASTPRPPNGVGSGLSGDDVPFDPRQQQLRFGHA